jgi:hypothetical protein
MAITQDHRRGYLEAREDRFSLPIIMLIANAPSSQIVAVVNYNGVQL